MSSTLFAKARALATSLESNVSAEIAAYSPRLHAAVDDAEHRLVAWQADVEHWIELHFQPVAEKAKNESRKLYEEALRYVHDLHAEASTKTN